MTNRNLHTRVQHMQIAKILVPVVGVLGMLLFAAPAFAQTPDDYGIAAVGTYCPTLSITMQRGARDISTNNQVSELQKFLADYYDIDPDEIVTGFFGRITQGYVQQFQREQGLPTFGIAGSMTRGVIARVCTQVSTVTSQINNTPTNTTTQSSSAPTCTIGSNKLNPATNEPFVITWSTTNISSPVLYEQRRGGGHTAVEANGSRIFTEYSAGTATFQIGGGGIGASYNPICSVTVNVNQVSAVGTIDPSSLAPSSGSFIMSGSASGSSRVDVYVVPASYTGGTDRQSLGNLVKGGGIPGAASNLSYVSNGRWSTSFGGFAGGSYKIYVLDISSCTISSCGATPLLASASFSIPVQAPTCTLNATNPYDSSGSQIPVTLTWASQNASHATMQYRWENNSTWTAMNNVSANGSMVVTPTGTTYYSLTFYGSGGSKECVVIVGLKG